MASLSNSHSSSKFVQEHIQISDSSTSDFYGSSQEIISKPDTNGPAGGSNAVINLIPSEDNDAYFDDEQDNSYFENIPLEFDSNAPKLNISHEEIVTARIQSPSSTKMTSSTYFKATAHKEDAELSPLEDFYSLKDADSDDEVAIYFRKLYEKHAHNPLPSFSSKLESPRRKRAFAASSASAHDSYAPSENGFNAKSKNGFSSSKRWSSFKRRPKNYAN